MKIKQAISLTMIAAMLSASCVSVHAGDTSVKGDWNVTPDDWTINLHSADTVDKSQEYIGITENGHSGKGLVFSEGSADGFMDARAAITTNIVKDNQYTLSYWYKGTGPADMQVLLDSTWNVRYQAPAEDKDGEWHLQTHTFTASTDLTEIILIAENTLNCVIDDFSIKDSEGNELVKNSNFDRIIYHDRVGHEDNYELNSWYIEGMSSEMDINGHYARATDKYEHSNGGHSLHIKYTESTTSGHFIRLRNRVNTKFESGQKYCLELYVKDGVANPSCINVGTIWLGDWMGNVNYRIDEMVKGETDENGWTRYSREFTANSDSEGDVQLLITGKNDLIIDDIAVYKTSDASKTNLVTNGGFEDVYPTNFKAVDLNKMMGTTINYSNIPEEYKANYYAEPSERVAHSGDYSMHIRYPHESVPNRFIQVRQELPENCNGDYTITFYTYGNYNGFNAGIGWDSGYGHSSTYTRETQTDGWVKHTKTVTVDGNGDDYMNFIVDGKNDLYLDDFSIVKVGSDVNLVPDGGFNNVFVTNLVAEGNYRTTGPTQYQYNNVPSEYKDMYYAEPSTRVVRSGDYSMHIRYPHESVPNRFIRIFQYFPEPCTAGKYTITFYTYGEYNMYFIHAGIAWGGEGYRDGQNMTREEQSDGWTKHTVEVEIDGNGDDYMNLIIDGKTDIYLDDFSIVKEGTTENVVPDGGFESVEKISYSATKVAAISAGRGAVNLFWTNPYENADNIEVYADGNLVSGTYDLSAGYRNSVTITGLENYVATPVEIVVTSNGKKHVTKIDVTADDFGSEYSLGDWRIKRFDPINSSFNIDDEVYAEGNSSMRIDVNYDAWTDNYYPHIVQSIKGLDPTASYTLTFKAKADNIGNFKFIEGKAWKEEIFIRDYGNTTGERTHDWKEYTVVIGAKSDITTETYDTDLYFCVETGVGSLWLDDMKLYKGMTLPNGTQIIDPSVNYIKNGGFEYEKYAIQDPVFSKDGVVIHALESGIIETKVRIKNYTMGSSFKPALIVALYNGTKLVDISFIEQNITQNILDGIPSDELAVTINVPEMTTETDYNLKIMYWDGVNSMKALAGSDVLK